MRSDKMIFFIQFMNFLANSFCLQTEKCIVVRSDLGYIVILIVVSSDLGIFLADDM